MEKVKDKAKRIRRKKHSVLLIASILFVLVFVLSPLLLRIGVFASIVDSFFEPLRFSEYKEAYISASGGMIGSFLAITGALWVERIVSKDNSEQEIEKNALILYYDIKLYYDEVSPLAIEMPRILGLSSKSEKEEKYVLYKNRIGVHIHSEWIELVAGLKSILDEDELKKIYFFYGNVVDMKRLIEKDSVTKASIGRVNDIINKLGKKDNGKYMPSKEYGEILDRLKGIAEM